MHCALKLPQMFDSVQCIHIDVLKCVRQSSVESDCLVSRELCSLLVMSPTIHVVSCRSSHPLVEGFGLGGRDVNPEQINIRFNRWSLLA